MFFLSITIHSTDILSKRFLSDVISLKGNNEKCNEGNFWYNLIYKSMKNMSLQTTEIHSTDILSKRFLSDWNSLRGNNEKCNEGII